MPSGLKNPDEDLSSVNLMKTCHQVFSSESLLMTIRNSTSGITDSVCFSDKQIYIPYHIPH